LPGVPPEYFGLPEALPELTPVAMKNISFLLLAIFCQERAVEELLPGGKLQLFLPGKMMPYFLAVQKSKLVMGYG
jgi:hypothetical protein